MWNIASFASRHCFLCSV